MMLFLYTVNVGFKFVEVGSLVQKILGLQKVMKTSYLLQKSARLRRELHRLELVGVFSD
jgi:hypothetical protein